MVGLVAEETPIRDAAAVADFARRCFRPGGGDRVGVELEFLVFDRTAHARHVPMTRIAEALPVLPYGTRVTFEPGGQIELSASAGPLADAIAHLSADLRAVREALGRAGLVLFGVGLDPVRPARRQLRLPRYDAMAEFLGTPFGPLMMCSTASIQINLDLGDDPAARWERGHAVGPVLAAAFANSPLSAGRPCGWMSGRQAVWAGLDHSRTAPVPASSYTSHGPDGSPSAGRARRSGPGLADPADDWADYLLDARLMLIREEGEGCRPVRDGSTFRDWLDGTCPGGAGPEGGERPPTLDDLAYHATTVFPPVRPRGWLEIRYLDAQHPDQWPVCVAVTHALVADDRAADAALAATEPLRHAWTRAARHGLSDGPLRDAADTCFRAALEALPRLGAPPGLVADVAAFADRHVTTGRSPAADLLEAPGATAGGDRRPWPATEEPP
jgi:glutamate--cysteine ligase